MRLKGELKQAFSVAGFTVKGEGLEFLERALGRKTETEREAWLRKLMGTLRKLPLEDAVVGTEALEEALAECSQHRRDADARLSVIDAFAVPRLLYHEELDKFLPPPEAEAQLLHGPARSKWRLHRHRFALVQQKTLRHPIFAEGRGQTDSASRFRLLKLEELAARSTESEAVVLGVLSQLRGEAYFLEDGTGLVELDLSQARYHSGFICEGATVLAEGRGGGANPFKVSALGFPPIEKAEDTRRHFGALNFFGGPGAKAGAGSEKLRLVEAAHPEAFLVFLSDVWLDDGAVLGQLRRLLQGYASEPPVAFVLCGDFLSPQAPAGEARRARALRQAFVALADLIADEAGLAERTQFVFVPSPSDVGLGGVLPRPCLPGPVAEPLLSRVPNVHFTSNPCRLQYCSQEIVVFRENLVEKLCRNSVSAPSRAKEIPEQVVKTVQSQGHLAPLPLHVSPTHWEFEAALGLYPLPDLLVLADSGPAFQWPPPQDEPLDQSLPGPGPSPHRTANPGSFARAASSFLCYSPHTRLLDDSAVPPH